MLRATVPVLIVLLLPIGVRADDKQDVERLRQENLRLRETLLERDRKTLELLKQVEELRRRKVGAEVNEKTLRARNEALLEQLHALEKKLAEQRVGAPVVGAKDFPSEAVEGVVRKVDKSGLMVLSVGADVGLKKGHILHVYRLDAKRPEKSVYLGTVELVDVTPREAVARIRKGTGKDREILPGDKVASRLLEGKNP